MPSPEWNREVLIDVAFPKLPPLVYPVGRPIASVALAGSGLTVVFH